MAIHPMLRAYFPGLALCAGITIASIAAQRLEAGLLGRAWLESLVIAILLGTAVRTIWSPPAQYLPGQHFAAKTLLEVAVALMGATISLGALVSAGLPLVMAIAGTVIIAIGASFALGRAFGLPHKMAILIACGNAICGNSAIAAVAPVIDADSDDVATAIAFTAVLGVGVVLAVPLLTVALGLSPYAGGILAGLTVYAVPQVLAAAGPMGVVAVQIGTLVKLVRVLMLGPVVTLFAIAKARQDERTLDTRHEHSLLHFFPPFIIAFLTLAVLRSLGALPDAIVPVAHGAGNLLTIMAMAGLGLGVDLRSVSAAGPRVTSVVTLSLLILGGIAFLVLHMIGLG